MSADGRLCFISPRSYQETLGTVFCGTWSAGRAVGSELQHDASPHVRGRLVFDVETSADGSILVMAEGVFRGGPVPARADLRLARWRDGAFRLSPSDDAQFARINTDALEYAAALSQDMRTIAFTRAEGQAPFIHTGVWIAVRESADAPFGAPVRVSAIEGDSVEGPTFSPDGAAIYYHRRVNGRFSIWRVSR